MKKKTWFDLYEMLNGSSDRNLLRSHGMPIPMSCPPDKQRTNTCHKEIENGCAGCWRREIPEGTKVVLEFTEYANSGIRATCMIEKEEK